MTNARAGFERLRGALSAELGDDATRALLFESLTEWGTQVPETRDDVMAFLRGPVRKQLVERLGQGRSIAALIEAENALAIIDSGDDVPLRQRPSTIPPPRSSSTSTWTLKPIKKRPVQVVVLGANAEFRDALQGALGPSLVRINSTNTADRLDSTLDGERVDLILVDATAPATPKAVPLARQLAELSKSVLSAIWGAESDFGRELARAFEATGTPCVPIPSGEGITPFVDLVRSRKAE